MQRLLRATARCGVFASPDGALCCPKYSSRKTMSSTAVNYSQDSGNVIVLSDCTRAYVSANPIHQEPNSSRDGHTGLLLLLERAALLANFRFSRRSSIEAVVVCLLKLVTSF